MRTGSSASETGPPPRRSSAAAEPAWSGPPRPPPGSALEHPLEERRVRVLAERGGEPGLDRPDVDERDVEARAAHLDQVPADHDDAGSVGKHLERPHVQAV